MKHIIGGVKESALKQKDEYEKTGTRRMESLFMRRVPASIPVVYLEGFSYKLYLSARTVPLMK